MVKEEDIQLSEPETDCQLTMHHKIDEISNSQSMTEFIISCFPFMKKYQSKWGISSNN
ncbi:hypothetical protein Fmac_002208 [Flemingia macrophylla]|uniref:Uncharacterized protein n=1 Tax=Flemingia macrophylla TaxID=520843 RepID=A0ABD1NJ92_9FABA